MSDRRIEELLSAAADRLEEPKTISSSDARVKTNPASRTGKVSSVVRITKFDDFFGACDIFNPQFCQSSGRFSGAARKRWSEESISQPHQTGHGPRGIIAGNKTNEVGVVLNPVQRWAPGLVNFITAVAYHLCPSLPAAITQPGALTLADLCTTTLQSCLVNSRLPARKGLLSVSLRL